MMYKKTMLVLAVAAVMVQVMIVLMYSFTEVQISGYICMMIWMLSALVFRYSIERMKVI